MHLARERDRGERRRRQHREPSLERPERERQQERHGREHVPGRELRRSIRRQREHEPSGEGGRARDVELAQPEERGRPGAEVREQEEGVPGGDGAEQRLQRAEDERERPADEAHPLVDGRAEAVRVEPRRLTARQLVARQPEQVGRLEVVAPCCLAAARAAFCEERLVGLAERGPRRDGAGAEVED